MPTQKTSRAKTDRWAVRATNDLTGEIWAIHDTRAVCEDQLALKLDEWGQPDARVEWAELVDAVDRSHGVRAVVEADEVEVDEAEQ